MNNLKISKRGEAMISSPIRKFLPLVRKAEREGVEILKLNVGDPDIGTPASFYKSLHNLHPRTLGYSPSPGILEHAEAWAEYYRQFGIRIHHEQIIPTVGGSEAMLIALLAVTDPGDEILVFEPLYANYKSFAAALGIKLVPVTLHIENSFTVPDRKALEKKISKKTKAVLIVNPDNPTGKVWSKKELDEILKTANDNNLFILADETYRELVYNGKPSSLLAVKDPYQRIVVMDSASKRFSMPGARLGCIASFNQGIIDCALKFCMARLSAPTLEQQALIPVLKSSKSYTNKLLKEYGKRREIVINGLKKMPGVIWHAPQGAFYMGIKLPVGDSEDFVRFMVEEFRHNNKTVLVTPMKDFYISPHLGGSEIRIAYVINTQELKLAMDLLGRGLEAYKKIK